MDKICSTKTERKKTNPVLRIRNLIRKRYQYDNDVLLEDRPPVRFVDQGCWVGIEVWVGEEEYER